MNIHELEELDYNPRSDAENAYAFSHMTAELADPAVRIALDAGLYAVVLRTLAFCASTDACLGEREWLISAWRTAVEAEKAAATLNEILGWDEAYYTVLGPAPPAPPTVEPWGEDELPF